MTFIETIRAIVAAAGQTEAFAGRGLEDGHFHLKIENGPYMPLVIESFNTGRDRRVVSVAHYFEQNGDLMADPEVEVLWDGEPLTITQHPVGVYREVATFDVDGRFLIRPRAYRDLQSFLRMWGRNLKAQGFIEAAKRQAATATAA